MCEGSSARSSAKFRSSKVENRHLWFSHQRKCCCVPLSIWSCCRSPWSGGPVWMGFHNVLDPKGYLSVCYHKPFQSPQSSHTVVCHSVHCSMMLRSAKVWLVHQSPLFPEPCVSLSTVSALSDILLIIILARILLGIDNRVIPLHLLQLLRAPFFGNLKITSHQTLCLLPTQMWTVATGWWLLSQGPP